jgi:hypothetical protein
MVLVRLVDTVQYIHSKLATIISHSFVTRETGRVCSLVIKMTIGLFYMKFIESRGMM